MNIVIFTEVYYPFLSGVITHIETLKNSLEEAGHQVLIVTTDPTVHRHYIKDGVLYCPARIMKKIYGYGFTNPVSRRRLKIIQDFKPDLCHIHTEFSVGLFGLSAARHLHLPIVYTLHTMYDDYLFYVAPKPFDKVAKPASHWYFRKIAMKADEIIGPSTKVVEYLHRCGVNRPVNIVPNIVELSNFRPENNDLEKARGLRAGLGIAPDDVALCFVGRLGKEKSLDTLIHCFSDSFPDNTKVKLFLIGDGPEKESLHALAATCPAKERICFLGRIEHDALPSYYLAFDLFATASLSEINSISMLEALASGLYVIQRNDRLNKNQIEDGKNGKLFDTEEEFQKIVEEYAALPPQERQALRSSVCTSTSRYGKEEFVKAILEVYEKAIREHDVRWQAYKETEEEEHEKL